jgi:hypothetical protein
MLIWFSIKDVSFPWLMSKTRVDKAAIIVVKTTRNMMVILTVSFDISIYFMWTVDSGITSFIYSLM